MNLKSYTCFILVSITLALSGSISFAGSRDSVHVTLSPRVTGYSNSTIREVLDLWIEYLNSRPDSLYDNPYWSLEERRKLKYYDLSGSLLYRGMGKYFLQTWKPLVLSVDSISDGYRIQTAYVQCDTDYFYQSLWALQNVLVKRERGAWRLFNALPLEAAKLCNEKQLGRFKFIYSKGHTFNEAMAFKTVTFIDSLATQFSIPLRDTYEYYLTDNISDLTELIGMPFCLSMSTGVTYPEDGRIFTASGREFYPHELTHLLLGVCGSSFASEGIATWQGGSGFKEGSLENSIPEATEVARQAAQMPLDSLIVTPWHFRSKDLFYVTAGMVAALVYNAEGAAGIKKLQNVKQDELTVLIEKMLNTTDLTVGKIWDRYSKIKKSN